MKRILLLCAVVFCLFLTACQAASIGIIGGAGSKTNAVVTENEKIPVRMIKKDGKLYYDTGIKSEAVRCGMLDGALVKKASEYEIPQNDGESNFDNGEEYFGYQVINGNVEVTADGFTIFKPIEETEKDITKYKYCYVLKGTMPNATKESKLLVLANDNNLSFEAVTNSMFSSDSKDYLDIYVVYIEE